MVTSEEFLERFGGQVSPETQRARTFIKKYTPPKPKVSRRRSSGRSVSVTPKIKPPEIIEEPIYETRVDLAPPKPDVPLIEPGTVYGIQAGTFQYKGLDVPLVKYKTVPYGTYTSRPATPDEIGQLEAKESALTPGTAFGIRSPLQEFYEEKVGGIKKLGRQEIVDTSFLEDVRGFSAKFGKSGKVIGGIGIGLFPKTKGELITTGAMFGIGAGVGAGMKLGTLGLAKIPKAGKIISPAFKVSAYTGGVGLLGYEGVKVTKQISLEPDWVKRGEILGGTTRELAAMGVGFGVGGKAVSVARGLYVTKGRMELPLERITKPEVISGKETFPLAPKYKHKELFLETGIKLPELTQGKPGGFHVTGETFWKGRKDIVPAIGTSELPGLYISSEPSIHFSRIMGKKGYKLFPKWKEIISGEDPGIAFLKPKGFREVGFKKVSPYKIGKQTFKYKFEKPTKLGYIDIPKMKTEIEGIARPGAGEYLFESGKYYTTIKGTRVPIDVFKYKGVSEKLPKITPAKPGKVFTPKESSLPERPSIYPRGYKISSSKISSSLKSFSSGLSSGFKSYSPLYISKISSSKISSSLKSFSSGFSSGFKGYSSAISSALSYPKSYKISTMSLLPPAKKITTGVPDLDLYYPKKLKKAKAKRKYKRTPTFAAVHLDITAPKPFKGEFTGLVERPIII